MMEPTEQSKPNWGKPDEGSFMLNPGKVDRYKTRYFYKGRKSKESSSYIEHSAGPTEYVPPPTPPKTPKNGGIGNPHNLATSPGRAELRGYAKGGYTESPIPKPVEGAEVVDERTGEYKFPVTSPTSDELKEEWKNIYERAREQVVKSSGKEQVVKWATAEEIQAVGNLASQLGIKAVNNDAINPAHYKQYKGIEVIQLTEQLNFCRGSAVKYLTRAGTKPGADEIEDLKKARWYIDREIGRIENENSN